MALDEVRHRLVHVFLWQLFPDGLQGGFQLISRLGLWLESIVLFQHETWDMIAICASPVGSILETSMNPGQFACSQFCMTLER